MSRRSGRPRLSGTFVRVWLGQSLSGLGSGVTSFALGVWVFQETGSATRFTFVMVAASLPGLLASPVLGALADSWGHRRTMLAADLLQGVLVGVVWVLVVSGRLTLGAVYALLAAASLCTAMRTPAYGAAVPRLAPPALFGRANGMIQLATGSARVVAPAVAGFGLAAVGMSWLVFGDVATFVVAALLLATARFPDRAAPDRTPLLDRLRAGWRYLAGEPGLVSLLAYFALLNFVVGLALVLVTPMVLSFGSPAELGMVLAAGGAGAVGGGVLASVWRGPRRRVRGILELTPLLGLGLAIAGLRPWLPSIAFGLFLIHAGIPLVNATHQSVWQSQVPAALQGRVFALRQVAGQLSAPLGYLVAGPLADRVFVPLLVAEGPLAPVLGPLLGVGEGRGIGLQMLLMGGLVVLGVGAAALLPALRGLDLGESEATPAAAHSERRMVAGSSREAR